MGNKKWVDLSDRNAPVSLILNSVSFGSDTTNLIDEPVIIAQVLNTPSIDENLDYTVYQTASNVLRINGTGFVGAKKVDLYFQPPLTKEVAYEDVSKYPLRKNSIELRLRRGYEWRAIGDGPLAVVGVDTGGGTHLPPYLPTSFLLAHFLISPSIPPPFLTYILFPLKQALFDSMEMTASRSPMLQETWTNTKSQSKLRTKGYMPTKLT